jgi:hypothetical protein
VKKKKGGIPETFALSPAAQVSYAGPRELEACNVGRLEKRHPDLCRRRRRRRDDLSPPSPVPEAFAPVCLASMMRAPGVILLPSWNDREPVAPPLSSYPPINHHRRRPSAVCGQVPTASEVSPLPPSPTPKRDAHRQSPTRPSRRFSCTVGFPVGVPSHPPRSRRWRIRDDLTTPPPRCRTSARLHLTMPGDMPPSRRWRGSLARWLSSSSTARPPESLSTPTDPSWPSRSSGLVQCPCVPVGPFLLLSSWVFRGVQAPRPSRCHRSPCVSPPALVVGRMEVTRGGDTNSPFPFHGLLTTIPPSGLRAVPAPARVRRYRRSVNGTFPDVYRLSPLGKEGRWGTHRWGW